MFFGEKKLKDAKNNKKKKNIILNAVIIVCVIAALISGYMIYTDMSEYQEGDNIYEDIANSYVTTTDENNSDGTQNADPNQSADNGEQNGQGDAQDPASRYIVDFEKLKKVNPDIVAWLINDGTVINYPVVQSDDNSYYLDHLPNGTKNKLGALFVDYRINGDFSSRNTLVYGHHMKSGAMFASLVKYRKQAYYDEHPTMYLLTPEANYRIDIFSGYVTSINEDSFTFNFIDDNAFETFIAQRKAKSDFKSDIDVTAQDKIITLCTCTYEFSNARYVLHGKLTQINSVG